MTASNHLPKPPVDTNTMVDAQYAGAVLSHEQLFRLSKSTWLHHADVPVSKETPSDERVAKTQLRSKPVSRPPRH